MGGEPRSQGGSYRTGNPPKLLKKITGQMEAPGDGIRALEKKGGFEGVNRE